MIKNNKTNCHPEALAEGSHKILHCVQNDVVTQQGRSMVEMLGVLAVIGVLSVAGIAGYSIAMRNHRTNEVLNAASMLYVMAMAKNQGTGADTNYSELGTAPSGTTLNYTAETKSITINFTNEDDCKQAKSKLGDKAPNECSAATAPATGYSLTINFGETVTQAYPTYDYNEWRKEDCEDGYVFVDAPVSGCARTLDEAKEYCLTPEAVGIIPVVMIGARLVDRDPYNEKKYFECTNN